LSAVCFARGLASSATMNIYDSTVYNRTTSKHLALPVLNIIKPFTPKVIKSDPASPTNTANGTRFLHP
jgi:hypothetical protein